MFQWFPRFSEFAEFNEFNEVPLHLEKTLLAALNSLGCALPSFQSPPQGRCENSVRMAALWQLYMHEFHFAIALIFFTINDRGSPFSNLKRTITILWISPSEM